VKGTAFRRLFARFIKRALKRRPELDRALKEKKRRGLVYFKTGAAALYSSVFCFAVLFSLGELLRGEAFTSFFIFSGTAWLFFITWQTLRLVEEGAYVSFYYLLPVSDAQIVDHQFLQGIKLALLEAPFFASALLILYLGAGGPVEEAWEPPFPFFSMPLFCIVLSFVLINLLGRGFAGFLSMVCFILAAAVLIFRSPLRDAAAFFAPLGPPGWIQALWKRGFEQAQWEAAALALSLGAAACSWRYFRTHYEFHVQQYLPQEPEVPETEPPEVEPPAYSWSEPEEEQELSDAVRRRFMEELSEEERTRKACFMERLLLRLLKDDQKRAFYLIAHTPTQLTRSTLIVVGTAFGFSVLLLLLGAVLPTDWYMLFCAVVGACWLLFFGYAATGIFHSTPPRARLLFYAPLPVTLNTVYWIRLKSIALQLCVAFPLVPLLTQSIVYFGGAKSFVGALAGLRFWLVMAASAPAWPCLPFFAARKRSLFATFVFIPLFLFLVFVSLFFISGLMKPAHCALFLTALSAYSWLLLYYEGRAYLKGRMDMVNPSK